MSGSVVEGGRPAHEPEGRATPPGEEELAAEAYRAESEADHRHERRFALKVAVALLAVALVVVVHVLWG